MALRPAKCYRRLKRPNTRVSLRKPRRGYVKGVPEPKIHRFLAGNKKRDFPKVMRLVARQAVLIRHNALEATRIALNKNLETKLGKDAYLMRILVYPHHVMRENPLATGAGADRFQTGMRKAFPDEMGGMPYTADELPEEMAGSGPNRSSKQIEFINKELPEAIASAQAKNITPGGPKASPEPSREPSGGISEAERLDLELKQESVRLQSLDRAKYNKEWFLRSMEFVQADCKDKKDLKLESKRELLELIKEEMAQRKGEKK